MGILHQGGDFGDAPEQQRLKDTGEVEF